MRTSNRPNINAERSADLRAAPFILCLKKIPLICLQCGTKISCLLALRAPLEPSNNLTMLVILTAEFASRTWPQTHGSS
jgi:hypothetical protein